MEKYKYDSSHMIFGLIFSVLTVLIIYVGAANYVKWNKFKETAVPVNAEITDIHKRSKASSKNKNTVYTVYISYEYDGQEYSDELGYYVTGMTVGDTVTIKIDPDDPQDHMSDPLMANIICAVSALLTGIVGAAFFIYELRRGAYINSLIKAEKYVLAEYTGEKPSGLTVNNVKYERSVFVYTDSSGNKTTFRGRPHHPNKLPCYPCGTAKVYVDMENDSRKHYVSQENQP